MGVNIYYYMVAAVLLFGLLLPQHGKQKRIYVILMALLHTFVCGWRYMYLTGDLRKYAAGESGYYILSQYGWFDDVVFNEGRNFGFFWLEKFLATISGNNFQILLIVIAVIIEIAVAVIIYRYSPNPCLSYLIWNCFGFYLFGFSAIKQALAMGILLFAFTGIMEEKPKKFVLFTLLAGCIHAPALIFLPAYWIAKGRLSIGKLLLYAGSAAVIFLFRNQIVTFISEFYYDETDYMANTQLGGRFLMIVALLVAGILLRGFSGKNFSKLFNLMVVAAILQMFSGFDNVFTRLTDYYFQFLILYLPMMFYPEKDEIVQGGYQPRYISLSWKQRIAALLCVVMLSCLYYYRTTLSVTIEYEVDNYLNYRFSWEVTEE